MHNRKTIVHQINRQILQKFVYAIILQLLLDWSIFWCFYKSGRKVNQSRTYPHDERNYDLFTWLACSFPFSLGGFWRKNHIFVGVIWVCLCVLLLLSILLCFLHDILVILVGYNGQKEEQEHKDVYVEEIFTNFSYSRDVAVTNIFVVIICIRISI